jgi:hypothetical protein
MQTKQKSSPWVFYCTEKNLYIKQPFENMSADIYSVSTKSIRGFEKIVALKQIELAACGLRQIIIKLWKHTTTNFSTIDIIALTS